MWNKLIECVPNISEGHRRELAESIASAASGPDRKVIDLSMDPDHNRSVITIVGQPKGLLEGVLALAKKASELIDLNVHHGEHPRMGAVDVIPFIPVRGVTMADCVDLSRRVGERIAVDLKIPVYLYEESATSESRRNLAAIRKGEFEGFAEKITRPEWRPDFSKRRSIPRPVLCCRCARVPHRLQHRPRYIRPFCSKGDRARGPFLERRPALREGARLSSC